MQILITSLELNIFYGLFHTSASHLATTLPNKRPAAILPGILLEGLSSSELLNKQALAFTSRRFRAVNPDWNKALPSAYRDRLPLEGEHKIEDEPLSVMFPVSKLHVISAFTHPEMKGFQHCVQQPGT